MLCVGWCVEFFVGGCCVWCVVVDGVCVVVVFEGGVDGYVDLLYDW